VTAPSTRWLRRVPRTAAPRAQLLCFHYAGAGTSAFREWPTRLPEDVEVLLVQLPGREDRFREPLFRAMAPLVTALADAIADRLRPPFVFFGHSMGARVGFALAHELRARGLPGPAELVLSGTPAPSVTEWRHAHHLDDPDLVRHLVELGGMPQEVLTNTAVLDLMLPVIRADLELSETSPLGHAVPLDIPITALAGEHDAVAPPDMVRRWGLETTGRFEFTVLPGDHFFLHTSLGDVLGAVLLALDGASQRRPVPQRHRPLSGEEDA
jgi:medium-chain acyl-[acyl-carrier-protein] hydrolase